MIRKGRNPSDKVWEGISLSCVIVGADCMHVAVYMYAKSDIFSHKSYAWWRGPYRAGGAQDVCTRGGEHV